jgi:hypothetical protein
MIHHVPCACRGPQLHYSVHEVRCPKVVSERLGHTKVLMTLDVYAHVLPEMQRDAAALLGGCCRSLTHCLNCHFGLAGDKTTWNVKLKPVRTES